jgi:hypothetical protein
VSLLYDLRVKCIIAVFSASNVAPLLLSQSRVLWIIALMPSRLCCAVGPVTYAVKSSTNAIAPPWLSIRRCTRSALKKRNKIGDKGEPWGRLACDRSRILEDCLLTWIIVVRSEQNASIH